MDKENGKGFLCHFLLLFSTPRSRFYTRFFTFFVNVLCAKSFLCIWKTLTYVVALLIRRCLENCRLQIC